MDFGRVQECWNLVSRLRSFAAMVSFARIFRVCSPVNHSNAGSSESESSDSWNDLEVLESSLSDQEDV